jgi:hypothetical protein
MACSSARMLQAAKVKAQAHNGKGFSQPSSVGSENIVRLCHVSQTPLPQCFRVLYSGVNMTCQLATPPDTYKSPCIYQVLSLSLFEISRERF